MVETRKPPLLVLRGLDHVSLTVPDLEQASGFFVNVLGACELYRRELVPQGGGKEMEERFNAHPQATCRLAKLEICGVTLELFQYTAPDVRTETSRHCDPGGSHLGLVVDDVDEAVERLRQVPGVKVLGATSVIDPPHPLAGRKWVYFLTPWGHQLELVSSPPSQAKR